MTETTPTPVEEASPEQLKAEIKQKDAVIAAYGEAIEQLREIIMDGAVKNHRRAQEIIQVANLKVQVAGSGKAPGGPSAPPQG